MEADNPEADILDQIESMYIHEKRTRRQIGTKLRDLGLITSIKVEYIYIYKVVICVSVCLSVCLIITQEPLNRFVSRFNSGARERF